MYIMPCNGMLQGRDPLSNGKQQREATTHTHLHTHTHKDVPPSHLTSHSNTGFKH